MAPTFAKKRKPIMFVSLLMCFLGASLLAAAFGTEYWFVSDSEWSFNSEKVSGSVNFGLFKGSNKFEINEHRTHTLYVVCLDGKCMYSCGDTKKHREEQLQMLLDGKTEDLKEYCEKKVARRPTLLMDLTYVQVMQDVDKMKKTNLLSVISPAFNLVPVMDHRVESEHVKGNNLIDSQAADAPATSSTLDPNTTGPTSGPEDLEFMDYGLWVGTIACLSAGLLMAVVGALFAIVNTATTPVEAITGVPGLYLWNGLAALFDMLTVILWAVQFHKHLTSNVLLYDANDGWSTKGMEVFGYSFWLVLVAIFVHVANIVIIAVGTWEPKKKDQLQAPESKGGNIMLY